MDTHSLVIDRFRTRLTLAGRTEDGPPLAREVTRSVRDLLPGLCAAALGPRLGARGGVVRIDRVRLSLGLDRGDLSAAALADRLAQDLARRIAGVLEAGRPDPGIAVWPDHASFAAAYVAHRLGLVPAPDWAFPDFRPLAHLAPAGAAVELVAARPAILAALARLLAAGRASGRLAAALPERAAADLVARLAGAVPPPDPAGQGAALAAMLAALPADPAAAPGRAALAALLDRLAALPQEAGPVPPLAALARLAVALAAIGRAVRRDRGREAGPDDLVPAALVHLPRPVRDLAAAAIAPLAATAPARAALITLLRYAPGVRPAAPVPARDADAPDTAATAEGAAARVVASRVAGLGLLLPAALRHGLPEALAPAALHLVLVSALAEEDRPAARLDPLPAALAPFDPRDGPPAFPPVPDSLRAAVPEALRPGLAGTEGAPGWAGCLAHAFAAGLPGFEASSLGYLRRQFLARPGRLTVAPDRLTLVLAPLPLGILLRHAGLHGWTGRLRHAGNALLRVEIEDG